MAWTACVQPVMKNLTDGLTFWLAGSLLTLIGGTSASMNSARHEGILAKSASYLHLIAVALSDKSVEEMVSLLKAEPGEDHDKKPTASEPGQDRCRSEGAVC